MAQLRPEDCAGPFPISWHMRASEALSIINGFMTIQHPSITVHFLLQGILVGQWIIPQPVFQRRGELQHMHMNWPCRFYLNPAGYVWLTNLKNSVSAPLRSVAKSSCGMGRYPFYWWLSGRILLSGKEKRRWLVYCSHKFRYEPTDWDPFQFSYRWKL